MADTVESMYIDATFKSAPKSTGWSVLPQRSCQLLNVLVEYQGRFIPALHVVMATKRFELYKLVMLKVREIFPNLRPTVLMADFESGLRKALKLAFPLATLHGCRFHYAKALHFRLKSKLGLAAYYRPGSSNLRLCKLSHTLRSFMSLALLLPHDIKLEVLRLRDELRNAAVVPDVKKKLELFYRYFTKTWMRRMGAANFSVAKIQNKSNNCVESFHKVILTS